MQGHDQGTSVCVILAYNCASALESTFRRIPPGAVDRVILVDDGSTDTTLEEAKRLGIEYYTHPNLGYGGNIKYSIKKAIELGAYYIVDLHGDGQYDPATLPAALSKAREGYDLILGTRFKPDLRQPLRDGMSWVRYLANIGLSAIERVALGSSISEFHTGFRVYTKRLAESIALERASNDFLFGFEIIAQACFAKLRIGEVPIRCDYKEEHSSISLSRSTVYAFQTFKVLGLYTLAKIGFPVSLFAGRAPVGAEQLHRYRQFIQFAIAGGTALAVNLAVLYVLTSVIGVYYLFSVAIAFCISFVVSFMLQKFWTFRHYSRDRLHIEIPLYLAMQLGNLTINELCIYIFVQYLHLWYLLSQAIISLGLAYIVFVINKRYIFRVPAAG